MDELQNYIDQLLNKEFYELNQQYDYSNVDLNEVFNAVTSSRFRKSKLDDETIDDIKEKIRVAYNNKEPLKFSVPFGAYKPWYLKLNSTIEWSEVLNVSYLMKYASNIIKYYPYGVDITYSYLSKFIYFVSDIDNDDAQRYIDDFKKALEMFNKLDSRIQFHLFEINNLYKNESESFFDFLEQFLDNLVYWDIKYDEETRQRHLNSSHHNLNPYGHRKIAEKPEDIQERYYYYSALMTDAIDCMKERRKFNKGEDKIQIVGVKGPKKCINMGSCETGATHFWVSKGVLSFNKGIVRPYIFTNKKLEEFNEQHLLEKIRVNSEFENINDNFKYILFLKEAN